MTHLRSSFFRQCDRVIFVLVNIFSNIIVNKKAFACLSLNTIACTVPLNV